VVEIESRSIRKPFIGGYRHKITDVEYHHAFTQTPSLQFMVSAGGNYCVVYEHGYFNMSVSEHREFKLERINMVIV